MGTTKSKSAKDPLYSNCKCIKYAKFGAYQNKKKRCLSLDGHYCICSTIYNGWDRKKCRSMCYLQTPYCLANNHPCICERITSPKLCKTELHICLCKTEEYEKCRSNMHPCICTIRSPKYCKASIHWCTCVKYGPKYCKDRKSVV